ncbi:MAG: hypothetical protein ACXAC7_21290, partial [Candidatus Hodarchaeales archaeon]
ILAKRAHRVGGDARKLIKMLKFAIEEAEKSNSPQVQIKHADYAVKQIDDESHFLSDSLVNKSHDIHVILLATHYLNKESDLEDDSFSVKSGEIVRKYSELIKKSSKEEPLKYRSIMDLLQKLLSEGLIDRTRARTRGNVWFYEINAYISGEEIERILNRICPKCESIIPDID